MKNALAAVLLATACTATPPMVASRDDARAVFADTVAAMLLDTTLFEIRGQLYEKIPNPNRDDESPLADREVPHPSAPGPHTMSGQLYADLSVLRNLLGPAVPVEVDTARDHVFVGVPEVLLIGHQHGDVMYVPVKLFARQFGAYTDITCTLANCGYIWPRSVIDSMIRLGAVGGSGILEGFAEGLVRNVDVRKLPGG